MGPQSASRRNRQQHASFALIALVIALGGCTKKSSTAKVTVNEPPANATTPTLPDASPPPSSGFRIHADALSIGGDASPNIQGNFQLGPVSIDTLGAGQDPGTSLVPASYKIQTGIL
jgi:hypothetical protein